MSGLGPDLQSFCRAVFLWLSEQHGSRAPLRNGWARVSVPNPGQLSVITKPAPEKHHSPQGPVAHFYKEPKMLVSFAKLLFLSVPRLCEDYAAGWTLAPRCPTTLYIFIRLKVEVSHHKQFSTECTYALHSASVSLPF